MTVVRLVSIKVDIEPEVSARQISILKQVLFHLFFAAHFEWRLANLEL
jgi:hypothetical protein